MENLQNNLNSTTITNNEQIQVIIAGLPRTGTTSIQKALEMLGFGKCYHFFEITENLDHHLFWNKVVTGKEYDFDDLFKKNGYRSCSDNPCSLFIKELLIKYPNAKVIINQRDSSDWYDSVYETIFTKRVEWVKKYPQTYDISSYWYYKVLEGKFLDKEYCIQYYNNHLANVKKLVKKENLLDNYDVSNGWEKLCKFLDKEIPVEDFPFLNNRDVMNKRLD